MLVVTICIGSSCHLKGSYDVLERLKLLACRQKVTDRMELMASFCMSDCTNSVCVTVGGEKFSRINLQNIDELFVGQILPRIEQMKKDTDLVGK